MLATLGGRGPQRRNDSSLGREGVESTTSEEPKRESGSEQTHAWRTCGHFPNCRTDQSTSSDCNFLYRNPWPLGLLDSQRGRRLAPAYKLT